MISITAVTVPSPLSAKMMCSAAWFTGCTAEQKKPPHASAGEEPPSTAVSTAPPRTNDFRVRFMVGFLRDVNEKCSEFAPDGARQSMLEHGMIWHKSAQNPPYSRGRPRVQQFWCQ